MLVGYSDEPKVYSFRVALQMAEDDDMDLVLVNANGDIPVCKIMDYNKFIFNQQKNVSKVKSKPMKTVRFRPTTGDNDLETKFNQMVTFLKKGHKVKAYVFFKGRELKFKDEGEKLLLEISQKITDENLGTPESLPKMDGGNKMNMMFKPKSK